MVPVEVHVTADVGGPLGEQVQGLGGGERCHSTNHLTVETERLSTRDQQRRCELPRQELHDQVRERLDDVLAVVQHDHGAQLPEPVAQGRGERFLCSLLDVEHLCDVGWQLHRILNRREVDEPRPVRELRQRLGARLQGQPGLAHPTGPGQGHEVVPSEVAHQLLDLGLTADECRELSRQVRGEGVDAPDLRELPRPDLVDPLRAGEVAEAMLTQIDQVAGFAYLGERLRCEDLSSVAGGHDPRRPIQRRPEVVTVALVGLPDVEAHANPDDRAAPGLPSEHPLRCGRSRERIGRGCESDREPVAARGEHVPAVVLERFADDHVVPSERLGHLVAVLFPESGRTFDVGEQERDGPRRSAR